jgi:prevent-host-death family protein
VLADGACHRLDHVECVHKDWYCGHMNVGVRELKQHLSDYLDRAAAGEVIQVTDRGVPKVQIIPVPGVGQLQRGVQEGWLRAPAHPEPLGPVRRAAGRRRVAEVLDEDRGV